MARSILKLSKEIEVKEKLGRIKMKVIRTFHPVGQGAFYSERFYEDSTPEAKHNIVFDCGTAWGHVGKMKKVVSQAFNQNDVIDYLFISHLDYDHMSLVNTLLSIVHGVKNSCLLR